MIVAGVGLVSEEVNSEAESGCMCFFVDGHPSFYLISARCDVVSIVAKGHI
jgi:hypothetical protein